MKKLFFAAFATFAMVSISSVFANKAMIGNAPDGLANDTTDTTVTSTPVEPEDVTAEPTTNSSEPTTEVAEPAIGNTAGDGMYLMEPVDTTKKDTAATVE